MPLGDLLVTFPHAVLTDRRNGLIYWRARRDSNSRPPGSKSSTLNRVSFCLRAGIPDIFVQQNGPIWPYFVLFGPI